MVSSWTASGTKLSTTIASAREPEAQHPPALGADRPRPGIRHQQGPDDRQHRHAQHVALHRDRRPDAGQQPPARVARRPGPPGTGQRDRARQRDEVRVPDERRFLDRRGRDRHRQPGDEPGHRAADRPRQPPRHEDRGDPGQRDECRRPPAANRRRSGTRPGRAGSSRPRRGGRHRSRSVVRAAGPRRRGRAPAASACRGPGRRPTSRAWRGPGAAAGPPARASRSGPGRAPSPGRAREPVVTRPRPRARPGPGRVLARLPRRFIASGGRSASGRQAAMS